MTTPSKKRVLWTVMFLMLLGIGAAATKLFRVANAAVDYSAHAGLTSEICDTLAGVPPGQHYPAALSQLQLRFPDGGDPSLLSRFVYTSNGTNCMLGTVLRGQEFVCSYP